MPHDDAPDSGHADERAVVMMVVMVVVMVMIVVVIASLRAAIVSTAPLILVVVVMGGLGQFDAVARSGRAGVLCLRRLVGPQEGACVGDRREQV